MGCMVAMQLSLACAAQAGETITWAMFNIPPLAIGSGPTKGQGIQDRVIRHLAEHLPAYEHQEVVAPIARASAEMQLGHHWCALFLRKPEREAWAEFSLPALMALPNWVVIRRTQLSRFQTFGTPLSLETLLADPSLRISVERERAYGSQIDPLLKPLTRLSLHLDTPQAVKMLLAERFDYFLESPAVAQYTARTLDLPDALIALPTNESGTPYLVRVACAKNAWGQQVIDEVNAVLRAERPKATYRRLMERWLDPAGVAEIRRHYDTLFLNSE